MGYAINLREMFEVILKYDWKGDEVPSGRINDQTSVGRYLTENPGKIQVDGDCQLSWTDINFRPDCPKKHSHPKHIRSAVDKLKNEIVVNGRMYNPITNTYPCIFHCPNGAKTWKVLGTAWDLIRKTN